ncbi:hypothetical protein VTO73DRAFT_11290 [Trametes versicolor]
MTTPAITAFIATELLRAAIKSDETIARTAAHDLESFCWVFVLTLYLRAVRDAPEDRTRLALRMEYHTIFAARSREELLEKRYIALPPDLDYLFESIQYLSTHLDDIGETTLGIYLNTCWYLIKGFQFTRSARLSQHILTWTTTRQLVPRPTLPLYITILPMVTKGSPAGTPSSFHGSFMAAAEDPMLFVATELLRGSAAGRNVTQTSEHDIESFCWVFMYVLWLRAVKDAPTGKQRYALQAEFREVFGATSAKELADKRALALPMDKTTYRKKARYLLKDIHGFDRGLADSAYTCWRVLRDFQPVPSLDSDLEDSLYEPEEAGKYARLNNSRDTDHDVKVVKSTYGDLLFIFNVDAQPKISEPPPPAKPDV